MELLLELSPHLHGLQTVILGLSGGPDLPYDSHALMTSFGGGHFVTAADIHELLLQPYAAPLRQQFWNVSCCRPGPAIPRTMASVTRSQLGTQPIDETMLDTFVRGNGLREWVMGPAIIRRALEVARSSLENTQPEITVGQLFDEPVPQRNISFRIPVRTKTSLATRPDTRELPLDEFKEDPPIARRAIVALSRRISQNLLLPKSTPKKEEVDLPEEEGVIVTPIGIKILRVLEIQQGIDRQLYLHRVHLAPILRIKPRRSLEKCSHQNNARTAENNPYEATYDHRDILLPKRRQRCHSLVPIELFPSSDVSALEGLRVALARDAPPPPRRPTRHGPFLAPKGRVTMRPNNTLQDILVRVPKPIPPFVGLKAEQ